MKLLTILNEEVSKNKLDSKYSKVGNRLDGLRILKDIPNVSSIRATFTDYVILDGVRMIPIAEFDAKPTDLFYSKSDIDWVKELAEEIKDSGEIKPLISVYDNRGFYILEGAHRLGALYLLNVNYIPALIVIEN